AERHNDPGEFATLLAFEWTGRMHPGPGHKVVYLPKTGLPVLSRDVLKDGKSLVDEVKRHGGFAVPHHVGWTGADEGAHDVVGQPVWEICSCHGCYESFAHELGQRGDLREQMVDAVLRRGHRFGFIASSDGHGLLWHHGVARKRDPFRTGLAAVQSTARTREAILEALRARRCYATSGAKILLDFRANDAPMGSDLRASGAVRFTAEVTGTASVRDLELVGPDAVLARATGEGPRATLTFEAPSAPAYAYARVRQEDGEMAWSSPIFFEKSGA
ncbi:MAG: CehA/McbA family metallohydrolase, partial [Myxococcales bacterium]|nr:CehA/McbA family metallohydrolase [Myxococcales bacterium]